MDQKERYKDGTLLIAWNAKSGWQHAVMDSLHKWVSPQTYSCKLCQLTYGAVGPRESWKVFLESLKRKVLFFHKDAIDGLETRINFPERLPFITEYSDGEWHVLLSAEDLDQIDTLEGLLADLRQRLDGGSYEFVGKGQGR